jgi:hypothetical protein
MTTAGFENGGFSIPPIFSLVHSRLVQSYSLWPTLVAPMFCVPISINASHTGSDWPFLIGGFKYVLHISILDKANADFFLLESLTPCKLCDIDSLPDSLLNLVRAYAISFLAWI